MPGGIDGFAGHPEFGVGVSAISMNQAQAFKNEVVARRKD